MRARSLIGTDPLAIEFHQKNGGSKPPLCDSNQTLSQGGGLLPLSVADGTLIKFSLTIG